MTLFLQKNCIAATAAVCAFIILAGLAVPTVAAPMRAGSSNPGNSEDNQLAESLGQLLGIPLDTDMRSEEQKIPEFLMEIYNCWRDGHPEECSVSPSANLVRSFVATVDKDPPVALESMSNERLTNTFALSFNMSCSLKPNEELLSSKLRVFKEALDVAAMDTLESKCSDLSEFEVQLYVRIIEIEHTDIMWLKSSTVVTASDLMQDQWIEFDNLNEVYERAIKNAQDLSKYSLSFRLTLNPSHPCEARVSPTDLGFTSTPENEALIYGIARRENLDFRMMQTAFAALSQRSKRQAESEEVVATAATETITTETVNTETVIPTIEPSLSSPTNLNNEGSRINVTEYQRQSCRLNYHNISFADLGWGQYILTPAFYIANFCAGTCRYPFNARDNTTKHSYIQGLASHRNPGVIPPPCCAPEADTLAPLSVIYKAGPDVFLNEIWTGMIATSCGCL